MYTKFAVTVPSEIRVTVNDPFSRHIEVRRRTSEGMSSSVERKLCTKDEVAN